MHEPASLRLGLTRRLVAALFAVLLCGTFAAYRMGSHFGENAYDRALAEDVRTMADQLSVEHGAVRLNLPTEALKWLMADEGEVVLYRVTDMRTGKVVEQKGDLGALPRVRKEDTAQAFANVRINDLPMRVSYLVRPIGPARVPVLIEIAETTVKRQEMTDSILFGALVFMVTISILAVALVWYGVGRALSPLRLLEAEAKTRSGADLAPLDPLHAPEEVRGLIDAINSMMERVSSAMQSQSHFIANAAHQLRTPLAGLRLQAQLGLNASSPADMVGCLKEVEASAVRACDLVEKLLVLAKAENAANVTDRDAVDFQAVAHGVVDRFLPLADQHGVDLGVAGNGADFLVSGNAFLLGEMLGNLVHNAIVHGRRGGRVTIELHRHDAQVLLAVDDDGPGFGTATAQPGSRFHRFCRHDVSASQGSGGLGLAIVKEIVDRHHGEIVLDSMPGRGSRLELRFARWSGKEPPAHR